MGEVETVTSAAAVAASPYLGLSYYTEERSEVFFGRDAERKMIIGNLRAARLTLLYARSGVGKSSLLRAGVASRLRELAYRRRAMRDSAGYIPVVFSSWRDDPVQELIDEIEAAISPFLPADAKASLPRDGLSEALEVGASATGATVLVILDQFEEYFLYSSREKRRGGFADDFARCISRRDLRANFLISVREDAYAALGDLFKGQIANVYGNYLHLEYLDREAARDAILRPIDWFNAANEGEQPVTIDSQLVETVLNQVRTGEVVLEQAGQGRVTSRSGTPAREDIETPYLQLVMATLWERERHAGSHVLRLSTLTQLGGAQKIVSAHLGSALDDLSAEQREVAIEVFHQLVTPSGAKIAHTIPDLAHYSRGTRPEVEALVEKLTSGDRRILRHVPAPSGEDGEARVEIFHDVLARAILVWSRTQITARLAREKLAAEEQARRNRWSVRVYERLAKAIPAPVSRQLATVRSSGRSGSLLRRLASVSERPRHRRLVSRLVINQFAYATTLQPRALSLASDYTTWQSLTDRSYSGRLLPPATPEDHAVLPNEADIVALYRREQMVPSTDTSVMFMFFAQWLTDSSLRTSLTDCRRNESNHEIDLCQIYGVNADKAHLLRSHQGGRLKSQVIDGEEYPAFLFEPRSAGDPVVFKAEFEGLHDPAFISDVILRSAPEEQKDTFFAVGLEHGNSTIGNTIMNIVCLREHNRLAAMLAVEHPDWDDARIFETARNIMIVVLLKLVVEEYITHIGPFDFPIEAVPFIADEERWSRTNWRAIELNLLYRWHPLVPDAIGTGPDRLAATDFRNNNPLVLSEGIEALMKRCSNEPAGKIGLLNSPDFLVDSSNLDWPSVKEVTIALMRNARLRSFNDYREAYGLRRLISFEELTVDTDVQQRLAALYGHIDQLEWYVGIFAEDYPDYMMMGELMLYMVANDAFTQALSNPLLARNVFNQHTFTKTGMEVIKETRSLEQIVARNSVSPESVHVKFDVRDRRALR